MKKYRNFQVEVCLCGFLVTIGCEKLCFGTVEGLQQANTRYLDNPEEAERIYRAMDQRRSFEPPQNSLAEMAKQQIPKEERYGALGRTHD